MKQAGFYNSILPQFFELLPNYMLQITLRCHIHSVFFNAINPFLQAIKTLGSLDCKTICYQLITLIHTLDFEERLQNGFAKIDSLECL